MSQWKQSMYPPNPAILHCFLSHELYHNPSSYTSQKNLVVTSVTFLSLISHTQLITKFHT